MPQIAMVRALFCRRFTSWVLLKAAKERGIIVSGTGAAGNSTLEHIWALILATARYVVSEHVHAQAANPQWQNAIPVGLSGKTLGLVGLGRLGQSTAQVRPNLMPEAVLFRQLCNIRLQKRSI